MEKVISFNKEAIAKNKEERKAKKAEKKAERKAKKENGEKRDFKPVLKVASYLGTVMISIGGTLLATHYLSGNDAPVEEADAETIVDQPEISVPEMGATEV